MYLLDTRRILYSVSLFITDMAAKSPEKAKSEFHFGFYGKILYVELLWQPSCSMTIKCLRHLARGAYVKIRACKPISF